MSRQLICSGCGNEIAQDSDLVAPKAGSVYALRSEVVQQYDDEEVVWVPGWVCESCARKRAERLL
jgi:hypothetical protein